MLKRHLKTIVFVAFISCSSHNKKNTGNSDSRAANNFTNPLFPNPQVYPTKNQIEEAYRYVCHNGLHTRPLNTFESTKYVIDGSQYMPNTGKEKEAILHVEPVLNESMSNKGASTTLSYLLFEKRIKATIRYNPSKGEYETDPNLIALNVSPETGEA